jgi:hypothetical protein
VNLRRPPRPLPLPDHPPHTVALLRAAAHPDTAIARAAWDSLTGNGDTLDRVIDRMFSGGQQRLLPLLGARADALGLPPAARDACTSASTSSWGLNERLLSLAGPVIAALGEARIPTAALKGLSLLGDVYPQHALRPLGDVDVWVPHDRAPEALSIAQGLGWRAKHGPATAGPGPFLRVRSHAATLTGPVVGPSIDLHWRPVKASPVRMRAQRWPAELLEPVPATHPLSGTGLLRPRAELLLVQLAAHGVRADNLKLVHWIVDLQRVLASQPGADGALVARLAHELDVSLHVEAGLRAVTTLLGVALPDALTALPSQLHSRTGARPGSRARDELRRYEAAGRAHRLTDVDGRAARVAALWAMVRSQTTTRGVGAFAKLVVASSLAVVSDRRPTSR